MMDRALQSYIQDAERPYNIKVYKAEIHLSNGAPIAIHFVNRLELGYTGCRGNASVYEKLEGIKSVLNSTCLSTTKEQAAAEIAKVKNLLVEDREAMAKDTGQPDFAEKETKVGNRGGSKLGISTMAHKDCIKAMIRVRKNDYES